jgi:hypothetical protein
MIKCRECIDKSNEEGGIIKPTGRRPELDSLPARSFIIMEAKIMKMAKKFLAVALAGVLALSVLTGCGDSVKSKDIADSLTKIGVKVEQDDGVDKTAKETLKAIETLINSETNTGADKITLDNAVEVGDGKIIKTNNIINDPNSVVRKALGMMATGTPAETANATKKVQVALVNIENAKKDASLQAALVRDSLVPANNVVPSSNRKYVEPSKLGSAKTSDGKYILVVIVTDIVEKTGADYTSLM